MTHKDSWFLKIWDTAHPDIQGIGEAGPLPGLSPEKPEQVERELQDIVKKVSGVRLTQLETREQLEATFRTSSMSSSVLFALETALLDLRNGGKREIFLNDFLKGQPIPINGLVWMGGLDDMLQQVSIKLYEGFNCIKVKVGGLNFEKELDILQFIRRKYFRDEVMIRLDANGSFKEDDAYYKLMDCSRFDIHSIEQPLKAGSPLLAELCKTSPIPVVLDEELIGVRATQDKTILLDKINPPFIILKPSLHGGIQGCEEWIKLADERSIGWWMTSALESNIGLNAIAQFTANHPVTLHQGLGTGTIYSDNIPSPLTVRKGALLLNSQENWDLTELG
ncbi:MAG TPA: o-succinylbenzoate synthase [Cyclobacteriaceae bacterium]|nr:o-succinylbenzoate synthase [Cyclobacteriaceae bacterium]